MPTNANAEWTDVFAGGILMVDDDAANVKLLNRILRGAGYGNLLSTTDPRHVLGLFQQHDIDLLILDFNMPFLNGLQVMEQLQTLGREDLPPILILTAQNDQEHLVRSLRAGARDYVTKPFAVEELVARVRNLLQVQMHLRSMRGRAQWLEDRVRERTRELEDRNAELERFNYTVSHELKGPLVTLKGFVGSIVRDLQEKRYQRAQEDLQRVSNAADRMNERLSGLLALAQIGRPVNPVERTALGPLVQEALETVRRQIESQGITLRIAPDLPDVFGDRIQLREAYRHLIDNAAKHMGDGPDPLIEIGKRESDGETVLFVRNSGVGIDPRYLTRIFGLFEQLGPNRAGPGLGLPTVKRIIETAGGRVWAESGGAGEGSTFCFTLPARPR